jgi:hydroxymethylpyrimidine/phosphomethylpyrimidine kinase
MKTAGTTAFRPLVLNALYSGNDRGLTADILSAAALGGSALPVCTTMVVAGQEKVTDVVEVPADTVSAQIEHILANSSPTATRIGILGSAASAKEIFRLLGKGGAGPILFDVTLSGPYREDVADGRVRQVATDSLGVADLVSIRRRDAELVAGMEITSLDDAQVAVQRLGKLGARRVLLRCGRLKTRHFDADDAAEPFASDVYYDGEEFALFEAPFIESEGSVHGASSLYAAAILAELVQGAAYEPAIQAAKQLVAEALRFGQHSAYGQSLSYFWKLSHPDASRVN